MFLSPELILFAHFEFLDCKVVVVVRSILWVCFWGFGVRLCFWGFCFWLALLVMFGFQYCDGSMVVKFVRVKDYGALSYYRLAM